MRSIEELFHALLQNAYFAERELSKLFGAFADASEASALRRALSAQHAEMRGQIGRLELVFETIGRRPRARHNAATLGLVVDGENLIRQIEPGPVRDAAMQGAAREAVEYAKARYITLIEWAGQIGEHEAARLLHRTLEEKRAAGGLFGRKPDQSGAPAKAA